MANPSKEEITKAVKDKNIIVTGASSGIGERTAFLLSECGAQCNSNSTYGRKTKGCHA